MPRRTQKLIVAVSIAVVMFLGYVLERYAGWDDAFMTLGSIAVAVGGAYVVVVLMGRRRP
jgi:Cu/Ag efflux pump CusA